MLKIISLVKERLNLIPDLKKETLFLDGKFSVNEDSSSIKERKYLAYNGSLEVTLIFNKKGNLLKKPIFHLGLSKAGYPRHPLYIGYKQKPILWKI